MASCIQEQQLSRYKYEKKKEMDKNIKNQWWVAIVLFYVFWLQKSDMNMRFQEVRHLTIVAFDSYGVWKLIKELNVQQEFDKEVFKRYGTRIFSIKSPRVH